MNKKASLFIVVLVLMSLVLSACGGSSATSSEPVKVNFAYDWWAGYYPALIAIEKGFYAESNLDVVATKPELTDTMMADFLGGKYDFIGVSLGDLINLTQLSDDIYFVIASDESAGGDAFLSTTDIQSFADLKGKNIGVNQGSFAEVFVMATLAENGIGRGDVTIVNMDASELPAGLRDGTIEAGHTWEPYVTEAKNDGNKVLFSSADTPGLVIDGIVVRGAFVREHPEAAQAFVDGWFRAVDYWMANPEEGNEAAAKLSGDDPAEISLEGIDLKTLADNQALFQQGDTTASLFFTAQLYVDYFISSGALSKNPDVQKMLDGTFVNK